MTTLPQRPGQRRIGRFWIEEGLGLVVTGAIIILVVTVLYVLAALHGS